MYCWQELRDFKRHLFNLRAHIPQLYPAYHCSFFEMYKTWYYFYMYAVKPDYGCHTAHKTCANAHQILTAPVWNRSSIYAYIKYSVFFPYALNKQSRKKTHTVVTPSWQMEEKNRDKLTASLFLSSLNTNLSESQKVSWKSLSETKLEFPTLDQKKEHALLSAPLRGYIALA